MKNLTDAAAAVADPSRARIVYALRGRELCVCQLVELLGLATSTVSKHLSILRQAGLIESAKKGKFVYYAHAGGEAPEVPKRTIALVISALRNSPQARDDESALAKILRIDPEVLCCRMKIK